MLHGPLDTVSKMATHLRVLTRGGRERGGGEKGEEEEKAGERKSGRAREERKRKQAQCNREHNTHTWTPNLFYIHVKFNNKV